MTLDLNPFFFKGSSTACLLIHGATGSPPEMRGMGEYLAKQGLTVLGVRLAGHGTTPEDLATKTWRDFVASAEHGLTRLQAECEHVFVAGLSMGGLITLFLAEHHSLQGAIVMSAPSYMKDWRLRLLGIIGRVRAWHNAGGSDLVNSGAQQRVYFYRRIPTAFGAEFLRLQHETLSHLQQVRVPLLIMQGARDRTIPPNSGKHIYDHVGSKDKQLVWLKRSGHAVTVDAECDAVWSNAYRFIVDHSSTEAVPAAPSAGT